jgi:hypothetical protein
MSIRRFINIVEGVQDFDERAFFRRLSMLTLDLRKSPKDSPAYKDVVVKLFAEIRKGKQQFQDSGASPQSYGMFVDRINKILIQNGLAVAGQPEAGKSAKPVSVEPSLKVRDGRNRDEAEPSFDYTPDAPPEPSTKWTVVNLAVKQTPEGNNTVGVAQQSQDYFLIAKKAGGKLTANKTDQRTANQQFYAIVKNNGYTEVSPGAFQSVINQPKKVDDNLPQNKNVWR